MAEVNIWTNRALTAAEIEQIETVCDCDLRQDTDDFEYPYSKRESGSFANYFCGEDWDSDDTESLEIYSTEWSDDCPSKILALGIDAIIQAKGANYLLQSEKFFDEYFAQTEVKL